MSILHIITALYATVGIVSVIAYLPTIRDLYNKKKSANIISYILWSSTTFVTLLYSMFILSDFLFRAVSVINFVSCFVILVLALRLR